MNNPPPTMKQWTLEESEREGVAPRTVYARIKRGIYRLTLERVNARVIYVLKVERIRELWRDGKRQWLGIMPTLNGTTGKERHRLYMRKWRAMQ